MRNRADVDREIASENQAVRQQERFRKAKVEWRWLTPAEREERNAWIMELWAMGLSREDIAERVDLTVQRVSQIVNSFGAGWR